MRSIFVFLILLTMKILARVFYRVDVKFIGEVGYYSKISNNIISVCQAVRQGKMTSQQAVKQIQAQAQAQYRQYQIDLQNLE